MGDFLEEETLELSVESSGLVGIWGRSTTCANMCWHQAAMCVYRRAGGLVWLLWSMIQKHLVGWPVWAPRGKSSFLVMEDPGLLQGGIVAIELRLKTGLEWAIPLDGKWKRAGPRDRSWVEG